MMMIKSPCCPDNPTENLAFTLYAVSEEENSCFDEFDDIYSSMEQDLEILKTLAHERCLSDSEIETYLWLCGEIGEEVEQWILCNNYYL